jgi:hypothetical protein
LSVFLQFGQVDRPKQPLRQGGSVFSAAQSRTGCSGSAKLGLNFADASFGSVDEVYLAELGRDILHEQSLVFG